MLDYRWLCKSTSIPFDFRTIMTNNDGPSLRNDRKKVRKLIPLKPCSRTTLKSVPVEGEDASEAY